MVAVIGNPAAEGSNRGSDGNGRWFDGGLSRTKRDVTVVGSSAIEI